MNFHPFLLASDFLNLLSYTEIPSKPQLTYYYDCRRDVT